MTRLWKQGESIRVTCVADLPYAFLWRRQRHNVRIIAQQWRLDVGWWQVRIWRDYYKLTTDTHLLAVIYQDLLTDGWYLQQVYD